MKKHIALALFTSIATSQAAVYTFGLSPAGTDNAVGLSPLNEAPQVLNSTGSGNVTGTGITYDSSTLTLTLSLGYGSAFGFSNLTGASTAASIQGPAPTNTSAPIVFDLGPLNVLATNSADGGSIIGSVVLTTNENADLLSGQYYINIATAANPNGEIRGQLIPTDTAPTLDCPASTSAECAGPAGTLVTLSAGVSDADGDALTVVWTANGVTVQTNTIAAGASTTTTTVTLDGLYQFGTNIVNISVSDGIASPVTCTTTVAVVDTTPPVFTLASITPNVIWPPNHKMIPVQVTATATDICGSATTRIKSIQSNQSPNGKGSGHTSKDWQITGDLTALIRAERSGKDKGGRIYTITVEATDSAGNTTDTNLVVTVPHDQRSSTNSPSGPGNGNGNGNGNGHGNGNGNGNGKGNGNGNGKNK
jgi:hypothetical protein